MFPIINPNLFIDWGFNLIDVVGWTYVMMI